MLGARLGIYAQSQNLLADLGGWIHRTSSIWVSDLVINAILLFAWPPKSVQLLGAVLLCHSQIGSSPPSVELDTPFCLATSMLTRQATWLEIFVGRQRRVGTLKVFHSQVQPPRLPPAGSPMYSPT